MQEIIDNKLTHYSHCISIGSPGIKEPENIRNEFKKVLRLEFHDINRKKEKPKEENPVTPKMKDVRKIINFYNKTKNTADGYTIHCHAGVHRSVAAGYMLLYLMSNSVEYAKNELIRIKAFPLPNKRMIELFDMINNSTLSAELPGFEQRIKDFLDSKIEINHDDYLEEL